MFDPKNIHFVIIGYDRILDYRLNLEILRHNHKNGDQYWITTVFNGNPDHLVSGIGENNFILLQENKGYGLGALESINTGLKFASAGYRDIIVLINFDVWFCSSDGLKTLIDEFIQSNKSFAAGLLSDHNLPMTDCMLFKRNFLKEILPIQDEIWKTRLESEDLRKQYKGTQLGFQNVEEWMMNAYLTYKEKHQNEKTIIDDWYRFQRDGAPRYRFTEKYSLSHEHDFNIKKNLMQKYQISKGHVVNLFLQNKLGV